MLVALLTLANKASWKDAGSYMEIAKHTEEELDRSLCHTYTHTHAHTTLQCHISNPSSYILGNGCTLLQTTFIWSLL